MSTDDRYARARGRVEELARMEEDWDSYGALPVRPGVRTSALALIGLLAGRTSVAAPDDIYPTPDGNIVFEWRLPGQMIERLEVAGQGKLERMTTYPDRQAEFREGWPDDLLGAKA